ncbi:hypothetical protein [Nocardia sp. NPDC020380]|uniref:hypothetical protein n=1 Tax=Nocardia sp. NPDC020380 TaxID=3364309 RepID=UPI0037BCFFEF
MPLETPLGASIRWHRLVEKGVFTGLSIFPAVAAGEAILRMCVMSGHTPEMLRTSADAVASVLRQPL